MEARLAAETEDIKRGNAVRCENRVAELRAFLDGKSAERRRRIQEMADNFQVDVDQKLAAAASERAAKLSDLRAEIVSQTSFAEQEKSHEAAVERAKESIDFIARRMQCLKDAHEKRLATLQAEFSKMEKAKRQLERRKKTETLAIDEDYERRIQVEQVNLRNAMDNLAKLYDTDENERGCEILEAFRKVRETHNHTTDFVFRQRRELDLMKRSSQETCRDTKDKIAKLTHSAREQEINAKFPQIRADTDARIAAVTTQTTERLANIRAEIEKESSQKCAVLARVTDEIQADTRDFDTAAVEIRTESS
jgi:hypothetical protein